MEKYGVEDKKLLQEQELREVKARLREVRSTLDKTAEPTPELKELEQREHELTVELRSYTGGSDDQ